MLIELVFTIVEPLNAATVHKDGCAIITVTLHVSTTQKSKACIAQMTNVTFLSKGLNRK